MGSSSGGSVDVPYVENPDGFFVQSPFMQDVPAQRPGQLDMVAQQLSAGYGGPPQQYRDHMSGLYRPMQVPDYAAAQRARMAGMAPPGGQAPQQPADPFAPRPMSAADEEFIRRLVNQNPKNGR